MRVLSLGRGVPRGWTDRGCSRCQRKGRAPRGGCHLYRPAASDFVQVKPRGAVDHINPYQSMSILHGSCGLSTFSRVEQSHGQCSRPAKQGRCGWSSNASRQCELSFTRLRDTNPGGLSQHLLICWVGTGGH